MPTFTLKGHDSVYLAAFKERIGFCPAPIGNVEFEEELSIYGSGRGRLKFP
jgi:hypothetical protein